MIVVTLTATALGLVARSRHCAERAAFHRGKLPHHGVQCGESDVDYAKENWLTFHEESSIALERVSKMPWLLLYLPPAPAPVDPKKAAEQEQALDTERTNLAQEAREKYGVP